MCHCCILFFSNGAILVYDITDEDSFQKVLDEMNLSVFHFCINIFYISVRLIQPKCYKNLS